MQCVTLLGCRRLTGHPEAGQGPGGGLHPPRLRVPVGERAVRAALRRGGHRLHRPQAGDHRGECLQGSRCSYQMQGYPVYEASIHDGNVLQAGVLILRSLSRCLLGLGCGINGACCQPGACRSGRRSLLDWRCCSP